MSKHVRKILPLLLCLLLMACLLPAAYAADGSVDVTTLAELQSAINSGAESCTFTGKAGGPNQGLTLTVPAGFTLNIPSGFLCLDDLTVNGTLNVTNEGMLIVNESLTGSGAVNVAAGCLLNLPAACYDSESHELVSLIHNSSDNVTLVHTPANQAELRSATGKAQDAAGYGFKNGFLLLQDLTISNGAIMFFDGEIISVQNNATLTISEDAVIVSDETIMVENGNIRVLNGGRLVGNVELRPGTADFTVGGYFGGETIAVTNTDNPDSCVTGLDMSQFGRKEENAYVIFKRISEASEITVLRDAIANNESGFTLAGEEPVVLTRDLIVPKGFELTVANQLVIASGAQLMMNGSNSRAFVTGDITIAEGGSLLSVGGKINLAETGTLHISGTYTGTPGSRVEVPGADLENIQPRVIVDYDSGEFNGPGSVMISKALLEDFSSGGVDRSQIIDTPDIGAWSDAETEDAVEYFPGKDVDPEIFQIMCIDGRHSQIRLRGTGDLTLTDNLTIPEGFYLKVRTGSKLIVPEGKTLTINGKIEASGGSGQISVAGTMTTKQGQGEIELCDGGVLDVTGTLENNKTIFLGHNNRPDEAKPRLTIEAGAAYTGGTLTFRNNVTPNEVVEGIDLDACSFHHIQTASVTIYAPYGKENVEACLAVGRKDVDYLELRGIEEYRLSADIEIPVLDDGTVSKVDMHATRLIVPDGKSVIVNGELAVKELVIESGGELLLHENGTVAVSGKLTNNATIGMGDNAQIAVRGEFVNNRLIYLRSWNGTRPLIAIEAQGSYEEHGGFDVLTQFDYESAISAIDLSDYCRLVYVTADNNHVTRLFPGKDLNFDPNGFKQMCENGDTVYLEIRGRDTFQFESDVTIPNVMEVVANDVKLEVPAGVNVKLKGRMILRNSAALDLKGKLSDGTLELDEGTAVNLTGTCRLEPDKLRLDGEIAATGGGMSEPKLVALNNGRPNGRITVTAGSRPSVRIDGLDETKLSEWVKFNDNEGYFVLYYHAESDAEFSATMEDMKALPARFYGIQKLDYAAVVRGNVVFPGIEIRVAGYDGASLTIAEGAVLTAPTVMLQGAQMTVNGTFISISRDEPYNNHNGALILTQNDGLDAMLTVTDTGIVGGTDCSIELPQGTTDPTRYVSGINPGQLKVVPDPYRPFKIYAVAPELHLPESLNAIESEAFAGGSFNSVYIPESVTSIAPDAFGDRTGLKVYGEYGTEAAQFASDHHFPFAPLVWRGNQ